MSCPIKGCGVLTLLHGCGAVAIERILPLLHDGFLIQFRWLAVPRTGDNQAQELMAHVDSIALCSDQMVMLTWSSQGYEPTQVVEH